MTGTVISGTRYFEGLAAKTREAASTANDASKKGIEHFAQISDQAADEYGRLLAPVKLNIEYEPIYIHLEDAFIISPSGQRIPTAGAIWRGKLSSVDGFIFGGMTFGQPV